MGPARVQTSGTPGGSVSSAKQHMLQFGNSFGQERVHKRPRVILCLKGTGGFGFKSLGFKGLGFRLWGLGFGASGLRV